ncbi:hypothetical protein JZ751_013355 [Albula glossodonta]|uniref:Arf-GAP with dual PH domain-containing protein 1 n=1 Tax=Albula glossodonta TaxID=121402 RepID=A0A8T2MZJ5_9TELE|nr:hypothetical protein JZ751_013355 [Albula glossodonta]
MAADQERIRRHLQDILDQPGNRACADCGAEDPDWASVTLGVFVCQACSSFHRNIPHISSIKSLLSDPWEAAEVEGLASAGNLVAKARYEGKIPPFYYRPGHTDCQYERNEFVYIEKQEPYSAGYREGFLWKRGRDNGHFLSRKFILSEREGVLKYFNKHDAREPKAVMRIETLNATFQPAKIGHPHGLQVTYLRDKSTRNIFIYHEDGKEIVDWFNAIRAARFHYLQVAFPGAGDTDLVPKLTRNFMMEGYMEKTGPKHTEGFKKRWFTLDDRRLMYFKDPLCSGSVSSAFRQRYLSAPAAFPQRSGSITSALRQRFLSAPGAFPQRSGSVSSALRQHFLSDAFACGEVFIGSKDSGYSAQPGLPPSVQGHHWLHGITILTPDRKFLFTCETVTEQRNWISAFHKILNRPMKPQEYAVEANFKHKP